MKLIRIFKFYLSPEFNSKYLNRSIVDKCIQIKLFVQIY